MTDAERALWRLLRQRQVNGLRFRRQVPIDHYIVDFACLEARLVIEVDGGQHFELQADKTRDAYSGRRAFVYCASGTTTFSQTRMEFYRTIIETLELTF